MTVGVSKNENQLRMVQESPNLFTLPFLGAKKLTNGIVFDLSGRMMAGQLINQSLKNTPATGILIVMSRQLATGNSVTTDRVRRSIRHMNIPNPVFIRSF
jgi:hypothetical protein